jgi:hypothetical protein
MMMMMIMMMMVILYLKAREYYTQKKWNCLIFPDLLIEFHFHHQTHLNRRLSST